MTPKKFCKKYGVKVKGKFFDSSPYEGWECTTYKVKLTHLDREYKFKFRMGVMHTDFDKSSALACIGSDARSGMMSFYEFCDEFGENSDSIEARETWKACRKAYRKLYELCSSEEMFDALTSLEY